ncbi:hypothetical protein IWW36_003334 [Coemansia brasiliensis]|uniref:Mitochondrial carrier n=1 Tax=Coemansia brasiliensis TaxID=2650707 RepID=A0A9W8I5L9_9FUNG|nr:hypothetical protein IWW36_003334 [Coemansia brasiliensis]
MSQSEKVARGKLATNRRDDHTRQAPLPEPQINTLAQWRLILYENRTLASAITAAVTGMLVGYPFDSLKTRMQTHHYSSLLACARKSIADEGIYGLYRGLLPPLLTASAAKSLSFSVFEQMKQWLRQHDPYKHANLLLGLPNFQRNTIGSVALTAAVSGCASGAVIAALCCPLELIKVQMQLANLMSKSTSTLVAASKTTTGQAATIGGNSLVKPASQNKRPASPYWARSNLSVFREIVHQRGLLGMYYGLGLHMMRDASGTAIYFASYETIKETLRRLTGSDKTGVLTHMFAGGICGVLSWLLIFPVDLVKSTMQSQVLQPNNKQAFTSAWHCLHGIYGRLGLSGLYRGVSVSLIRAFPIHGLNFVVYEWARSTICRIAARPE